MKLEKKYKSFACEEQKKENIQLIKIQFDNDHVKRAGISEKKN